MREKLKVLLDECIENAADHELEVLKQMLEGFKNSKMAGNTSGPLISHVLKMEKSVEGETSFITIPINSLTDNSFQIVHGGVTATAIDTAMGVLANQYLPEGYGAVTTNLNIHYTAPGIGKYIKASASLLHKGTHTLVLEASVLRDDGKQIAHGTGSFFIIKKPSEHAPSAPKTF